MSSSKTGEESTSTSAFAFGSADDADFVDSDNDDTGDIEIVTPDGFLTNPNADEPATVDDPHADGLEPRDDVDVTVASDPVAKVPEEIGEDLEAEQGDTDWLDADDGLELGGADDGDLQFELEQDLGADPEFESNADGLIAESTAATNEPIATVPDRAIDDWISNSHDDAQANWLDHAKKGTRSTVIAVVLIALLIAVVAAAFILATQSST